LARPSPPEIGPAECGDGDSDASLSFEVSSSDDNDDRRNYGDGDSDGENDGNGKSTRKKWGKRGMVSSTAIPQPQPPESPELVAANTIVQNSQNRIALTAIDSENLIAAAEDEGRHELATVLSLQNVWDCRACGTTNTAPACFCGNRTTGPPAAAAPAPVPSISLNTEQLSVSSDVSSTSATLAVNPPSTRSTADETSPAVATDASNSRQFVVSLSPAEGSNHGCMVGDSDVAVSDDGSVSSTDTGQATLLNPILPLVAVEAQPLARTGVQRHHLLAAETSNSAAQTAAQAAPQAAAAAAVAAAATSSVGKESDSSSSDELESVPGSPHPLLRIGSEERTLDTTWSSTTTNGVVSATAKLLAPSVLAADLNGAVAMHVDSKTDSPQSGTSNSKGEEFQSHTHQDGLGTNGCANGGHQLVRVGEDDYDDDDDDNIAGLGNGAAKQVSIQPSPVAIVHGMDNATLRTVAGREAARLRLLEDEELLQDSAKRAAAKSAGVSSEMLTDEH
jgi:hypothetical protein